MEYHHPVRVFLRGLKTKRRNLQRVLFRYLFRLVPVSSRVIGPPRGICFDLPRYLAELRQADSSPEVDYRGIHPASRVEYPPCKTLGGAASPPVFSLPSAAELPPAGFAVLPRARIFGRRLAVINDHDQVVASLSREYGQDIRTHFVFSRPRLPRMTRLKGTSCFFGCVSGNNYYHWVLDCLPIFDILRRSAVDVNAVDHLIFTGVQQPFQKEMLAALGVPMNKVVETDRIRHIEAEQLLCASTQILSGGFPKWACDFLRNDVAAACLGKIRPGKPRRLYISREDAGVRRVRNGDEIEALLGARGFDKIVLGRLPVREQIAAFSNAEVVVAPHGAGLTNLVFAPPGTTVVECFAPEYQNSCYYELSCTAGHRYRYLLGETTEPAREKIPEMTRMDMTLSAKKLNQLLDEIGLVTRRSE